MNLFSIFDPSTSSLFSMNWMSFTIPVIFLPLNYWFSPSRWNIIFKKILFYITMEIKNNISNKTMKNIIMFFSLFWMILMMNLLSLYPYIFTTTSHLSTTLILALPMWLSLMLYGWVNMTNHMFIHLVPLSTPMMLSFFMVLIETVSNIIRPITLSVRLTANLIAGHLLMSLMSSIYENYQILYPFLSPMLMMLTTLEYAVAMIQSYVFITLMSLYLTEIE
uniref:ATP synthase subunit a n=1 Tax=Quadristernoseta cf. longigynium XFX-2019 TaxID=2695872 RepID=A0A6B9WGQ1_9ACAR|nr:ATP synthase subunit 6 [Quadristernoseta cf. longigynium XFX-2019]